MSKKMLINVMHPEEARVAIVEDGRLVELDIEIAGSEQTRGNVYKGVVVRVEQSLQAAFVDIGLKKLGFLQMGELHPDYWQWRDDVPEENRKRRPRIQEVLRRGQELIVQVEKGERDMKGAALTTYTSHPGRYMVLMPGSDSSGVSRKVEGEKDRKALKEMIAELEIPEGIGYIVRTEALGKTKTELKKDLQYLLKLHQGIREKAATLKAPALICEETDLVTRMIRDYFTAEIDEVLVDSKEFLKQIKTLFKETMPKFEKLVKLHLEKRPIFSRYQLEEQIDQIYEKKVPLPSGGSLVIEPTEALVSIDVNSGKTTGERGVEDTAFKTNQEAAEEVARQLRLRDLGGLIVIDFIDMRDRKHMAEVEKILKNALKADKARVTVGKISQFGMLEMSRQRIKQTIDQAIHLECPHCGGRGKVKSVEAMALSFLRKVHGAAAKGTAAEVRGGVPLEIAYYLLNRKKRDLAQIEDDYEISVTVKGKTSYLMNQLELEVIKRDKPLPAEPSHAEEFAPVQKEPPVPAAAEPLDASSDEAGAKKKRKRSKKKKPVEGGEPAEASAPESPVAQQPEDLTDEEPSDETASDQAAPDGSEPAGEVRKKRRRRRKKKGKGTEAGGESAAESLPEQAEMADSEDEHEAAETEKAEGGEEPTISSEARKKRRRRRRKPKSGGETAPAGDEAVAAPAAPPQDVPESIPLAAVEEKPAKPRRAPRKKAAAEPAVEPAPSLPVEAPAELKKAAKPRRSPRSKQAADEPAAPLQQEEASGMKPKPVRKPRASKKAAPKE
jgi:ribonuclease E